MRKFAKILIIEAAHDSFFEVPDYVPDQNNHRYKIGVELNFLQECDIK